MGVSLLMVFWTQCCVIIMVQPSDVTGKRCSSGWFGPSCKLMCHCSGYVGCKYNGECYNHAPCEHNFFGPGCQYVDISARYALPSVPIYLHDQNDTTCNPQRNATSVEINFSNQKTFFWYRIIVNDNESVDRLVTFNTTFDNGESCVNERKFVLNQKTVDVTCDVSVLVTILRVEGNIAAHVCSVYVSGGRNIALRETTYQSSTLHGDTHLYGSDNAVDGITVPTLENCSCSRTSRSKYGEDLLLNFSRPAIVYSLKIYTSRAQQYRLMNVSLMTEDLVTEYMYMSMEITSIYRILIRPVDKIKFVLLTSLPGSGHEHLNTSMTICEVQVFGDTICPNGTFGLMCEGNCSCTDSQVCNFITGACASKCQPDMYGVNCSSRCSEKCLDNSCDYISGNCLHCVPGYMGSQCSNACQPGRFGLECQLNCSYGCEDTCNITDGVCVCKRPFTGLLCTECSQGWYGELCDKSCSEFCFGKFCKRSTGECGLCFGHRLGQFCEECLHNFYGIKCDMQCSDQCVNNTCDDVSGVCALCKSGFQGITCLLVKERMSPYVAALTAFPLILILFLCLPKWKSGHDSEENTKRPS